MSQQVTVSALYSYPVKSLRGIALSEAKLALQGLPLDRHWMVVDSQDRFVTQRQLPEMATISVRVSDGELILSHPQYADLSLPLDANGRRRQVTVWRDACEGIDQGDDAVDWLGQVLGRFRGGDLRLVRFATDLPRPVSQKHLHPGESADTQFSDGYPFLITNPASLDDLNDKLIAHGHEPVPMARFRSNIVVDGLAPWQENRVNWLEHESGFRLALRKPCERCPVITTDQETGERIDSSPLKILTAMQTIDKAGAFFGQNAILLPAHNPGSEAQLKTGDSLKVVFRDD